ncbi:MAG: carboxylate--amine ligase, partial [Steroidobacteraceae bacterium]
VDGPDTEIFFTLFVSDRDSRMIAMFAGRKIACSPPAVGSTAICVAAPEVDSTLRALTSRFVAQTEYQGLGSLEFKRDGRTGRFLIIEPTVGRTDWQEEIATLCGVNLPLLTYQIALGAPLPRQGAGALAPFAWRAGRQFPVPRALRASGTRVMDGYFRWSDPLPAMYYYGYERLALRAWHRAIHLTHRANRRTAEAH